MANNGKNILVVKMACASVQVECQGMVRAPAASGAGLSLRPALATVYGYQEHSRSRPLVPVSWAISQLLVCNIIPNKQSLVLQYENSELLPARTKWLLWSHQPHARLLQKEQNTRTLTMSPREVTGCLTEGQLQGRMRQPTSRLKSARDLQAPRGRSKRQVLIRPLLEQARILQCSQPHLAADLPMVRTNPTVQPPSLHCT